MGFCISGDEPSSPSVSNDTESRIQNLLQSEDAFEENTNLFEFTKL